MKERVQLVSFNGTQAGPGGGKPGNDYWKLIGETGQIVKDHPSEGIAPDRVLVRFDTEVAAQGLHCHNEVENSLWIRLSDLEFI